MSEDKQNDSWITVEPSSNNPTVLGKIHVIGDMSTVQVELLLQQALDVWQKNH